MSDTACRHAVAAGSNEQPKDIEAVLLGERTQRRQRIRFLHISVHTEIWLPVSMDISIGTELPITVRCSTKWRSEFRQFVLMIIIERGVSLFDIATTRSCNGAWAMAVVPCRCKGGARPRPARWRPDTGRCRPVRFGASKRIFDLLRGPHVAPFGFGTPWRPLADACVAAYGDDARAYDDDLANIADEQGHPHAGHGQADAEPAPPDGLPPAHHRAPTFAEQTPPTRRGRGESDRRIGDDAVRRRERSWQVLPSPRLHSASR